MVMLDPTQRAGILTQGAFLAAHAHTNQTSPVHRGIIVRENILCQPIPPPPPTVNVAPLPPVMGKPPRDRFVAPESDPNCAQCHKMMDPIGLAFENYDAIGAYRTEDQGIPIDATGQIVGGTDVLAGTFDGVIELSSKLGSSRQVSDCVANQWFRF